MISARSAFVLLGFVGVATVGCARRAPAITAEKRGVEERPASSTQPAYEAAVFDLLKRWAHARNTGDDVALNEIMTYAETAPYAMAHDRTLMAAAKLQAAHEKKGWASKEITAEWERERRGRDSMVAELMELSIPPVNEWWDADGGRFRFVRDNRGRLRIERADPPPADQKISIATMKQLIWIMDETRALIEQGRFEKFDDAVEFARVRLEKLRGPR